MEASNGPPLDSRLVAPPTVAPPPGVRPMTQPLFPAAVGAPLGFQGVTGLRPTQFNPATGLPLFQAQPNPAQASSAASRKSSMDRSKGGGQGSGGRKQCNCKNSRCLKLYCECFASGRYCENCNCLQCYNNREHEVTRQSAVEAILERNPNAFRPKIQAHEVAAAAVTAVINSGSGGPGRHLKGCNCKKSFCLKKYCECFQAGIYCSDNCKCVDCKNFEEAGSGGTGGTGGQTSSGPAKRVRYSSAPPPAVSAQGALGLACSLSGIRPGMVPPGALSTLMQQSGGMGVGVVQGVTPLVATGQGAGTRPGAAGAGLPLPQALSMVLAAATAAAAQQPNSSAQQMLPLLTSPQPSGQAPVLQPAVTGQPAPAQPQRWSMHEFVNGMVKREVIEELCRLLFMVADDEAALARAAAAGAGGLILPGPHVGDDAGQVQPPQSAAEAEDATMAACSTAATANGDAGSMVDECASLDAPQLGHDVRGMHGSADAAASAGNGEDLDVADEPASHMDVDGVASAAEGAVSAAVDQVSVGLLGGCSLPKGMEGDGVFGAGAEVGSTHYAASTAEPLLRRPGPLYVRRERVVLEEFLSILNKISDTAVKKVVHQVGPSPVLAASGQQQQQQQQLFQLPSSQHPHLQHQLQQQHNHTHHHQQQQQQQQAQLQLQLQQQLVLQPPSVSLVGSQPQPMGAASQQNHLQSVLFANAQAPSSGPQGQGVAPPSGPSMLQIVLSHPLSQTLPQSQQQQQQQQQQPGQVLGSGLQAPPLHQLHPGPGEASLFTGAPSSYMIGRQGSLDGQSAAQHGQSLAHPPPATASSAGQLPVPHAAPALQPQHALQAHGVPVILAPPRGGQGSAGMAAMQGQPPSQHQQPMAGPQFLQQPKVQQPQLYTDVTNQAATGTVFPGTFIQYGTAPPAHSLVAEPATEGADQLLDQLQAVHLQQSQQQQHSELNAEHLHPETPLQQHAAGVVPRLLHAPLGPPDGMLQPPVLCQLPPVDMPTADEEGEPAGGRDGALTMGVLLGNGVPISEGDSGDRNGGDLVVADGQA